MINKRKILTGLCILFISFMVVSCTAGPNEFKEVADAEGNIAGFWDGLWHGFILLFTFIASLFNSKVNIYEIYNAGPLYNLGFLLGVSIFFSGSGSAGKRSRKRKC